MKFIMVVYIMAVSTALALRARSSSHNNNGFGKETTRLLPKSDIVASSSLSASYMSTSSSQSFSDIKPPAQIFQGASDIGAVKANLDPFKIFTLGILSGCHIGFGAYLVLSVGSACPQIASTNPGLQKIIQGAFGLPFGLMMTLVGGGELFTGNTALITASLIEKKTTLRALLKNWFFSYVGNFLGSIILAYLAFASGTLGTDSAALKLAVVKTSLPFSQAFVRGLMCNWLVCMAVYMASGASTLVSKMVAIWFPISAFIALGLEHSVANMFLIPLGMLRGADVSMSSFLLRNLLPVTLGNIVGGAAIVAGMYAAAYGSHKSSSPRKAN